MERWVLVVACIALVVLGASGIVAAGLGAVLFTDPSVAEAKPIGLVLLAIGSGTGLALVSGLRGLLALRRAALADAPGEGGAR